MRNQRYKIIIISQYNSGGYTSPMFKVDKWYVDISKTGYTQTKFEGVYAHNSNDTPLHNKKFMIFETSPYFNVVLHGNVYIATIDKDNPAVHKFVNRIYTPLFDS